jgi:hypothetical protein
VKQGRDRAARIREKYSPKFRPIGFMKVVQLSRTGGPEVLELAERPIPKPDPARCWKRRC